jgi:hypothetical protein
VCRKHLDLILGVWQTHASWPPELWSKPDSQKYGQCIDRLKTTESKLIVSKFYSTKSLRLNVVNIKAVFVLGGYDNWRCGVWGHECLVLA